MVLNIYLIRWWGRGQREGKQARIQPTLWLDKTTTWWQGGQSSNLKALEFISLCACIREVWLVCKHGEVSHYLTGFTSHSSGSRTVYHTWHKAHTIFNYHFFRLMKAQALGDTASLEFMRGRRILEINTDHPIIKDLSVSWHKKSLLTILYYYLISNKCKLI